MKSSTRAGLSVSRMPDVVGETSPLRCDTVYPNLSTKLEVGSRWATKGKLTVEN